MKKNQIAAQLYTCRDLLKTPLEISQTLRRVREAGYHAVQVSGMGPIPEEELVKILDGEGLVCCATHEPGDVILNEPQLVIDRLAKLNCRYTAYAYPHGIDFDSESSVDAMIAGLDRSGAVLAAAGMTLCYHNHHIEFRKLLGRTVFERIFANTNPAHLQAEPDTYWIQYGGANPVVWCEKLLGRMPLIHLKDFMVNSENHSVFCEVGAGNLDFPAIIAAADKAGCQWFIVEQDTTPGDPVESLGQSLRYLEENLCVN